MVKIMENPIKMDDLGVPLFLETPKCYSQGTVFLETPCGFPFLAVYWTINSQRGHKNSAKPLTGFGVEWLLSFLEKTPTVISF